MRKPRKKFTKIEKESSKKIKQITKKINKKKKCKECGKKVEFFCPECNIKYCNKCAFNSDYQCGCIEPPNLKKI